MMNLYRIFYEVNYYCEGSDTIRSPIIVIGKIRHKKVSFAKMKKSVKKLTKDI